MIFDFNDAGKQYDPEAKFKPKSPLENPVENFYIKMDEYGYKPGSLLADGSIHRFDLKKQNDKNGWYVAYQNDGFLCGAFGDWVTGQKVEYTTLPTTFMADSDLAAWKTSSQKAKQQAEDARIAKHLEVKKKVQDLWNSSPPADPDHPYLKKKKVKAYGLRQHKDRLLVPMQDENGEIWSLQRIYPDNPPGFKTNKLNYPGGDPKGKAFIISGSDVIMIAEGYATGAFIHEHTGATVVVTFTSGNMPIVAEWVRKKNLFAKIAVCADNDWDDTPNAGVSKGREAANKISAVLLIPEFQTHIKDKSDFLDLAELEGLDAATKQLMSAPKESPPVGKAPQLPPLSEIKTRILGRVTERPAPTEFILNINGQGLIPKNIVGVLTATGGTGKTYFLLSLLHALASGENFGPISAVRPTKVLGIFGEDPQVEIDRRLWDVCKGQFPEKLHAVSVFGQVGPLMRLNGNVPEPADAYRWLEETIKLHPGLEVLILDPKSRFYGLDENNQDHATQWIACLESLVHRYNITILFTHHTAKNAAGKIDQNMSRGASAIVDGCRWQAGLIRMDTKEATTMGIEDPRNWVIFDAPKMNYAPDMPSALYFHRNSQTGVLEPAQSDVEGTLKQMARALAEIIHKDGMVKEFYTIRELKKNIGDGLDIGKPVVEEMQAQFDTFVRSVHMPLILNYMMKNEIAVTVPIQTKTRVREVVQIIKTDFMRADKK